jgi:cytochrome oxidase assembly protein ShyY1
VYRFALRPRWIVGHVVVLTLVVTMVNLGLWQLRRHDERRAENARIREGAQSTVALDSLVGAEGAALPDRAGFRRVQARGTFDAAHEIHVRFRSHGGLPGYEALTPLVVRPGVAVLVDRGWLPLQVGDTSTGLAPPPPDEVTVTGLLLPGEGMARFRPEQRRDGRLVVGAVHVAGLEQRLGYDLYPGFVQLQEPDDPNTYPEPLPDPDLGAGPHLSYAVQWFSFATIAGVGWWLLVRASARRRIRSTGPIPPGH